MWTSRTEQLTNDCGIKVSIDLDSKPASYSQVLDCWCGDADFRSMFIDLLTSSPFSAFRWETPAITASTANRPFEFVLLDAPELETKPDAHTFTEHFRGVAQGAIVEFPNLRKDAIP